MAFLFQVGSPVEPVAASAGHPILMGSRGNIRQPTTLSGTNRLVVPSVKLSTVGSRVFPGAGPQIWNVLPEDFTSAQ